MESEDVVFWHSDEQTKSSQKKEKTRNRHRKNKTEYKKQLNTQRIECNQNTLKMKEEQMPVQTTSRQFIVQDSQQEQQREQRAQRPPFQGKSILVQARKQELVRQPMPPQYKTDCWINVESNWFNNIYRIFLEDRKTLLLSAKCGFFSTSASFIISTNKHAIHTRDQAYVGRLTANFGATKWTLFDARSNPSLTITYKRNIFGFEGLRSFTVVKPNQSKFKKKDTNESVLFGNEKSKQIILQSSLPQMVGNKYVMDLKKKAKEASASNFKLMNGQKQSLILGKQSKGNYLLEVRHPLSMLQGFVVGISSLHSKLLVG